MNTKEKILRCIDAIYENDLDLVIRENYEVTISCKLAQYLFHKFPDYQVDCEYNKHLNNEKKLNGEVIRPDIVIHKRGRDDKNLVYIEIKTDHNTDSRDEDIEKIKGMTKQNGQYKYKLGVFIDFHKDKKQRYVKFFENGDVL